MRFPRSSWLFSLCLIVGCNLVVPQLSALTVEPGTLGPIFSPEHRTYTVNVPAGTAQLMVTPTAANDETLSVGTEGGELTLTDSGSAIPVALGPDTTSIIVRATAPGGRVSTDYVLTVVVGHPLPTVSAASPNSGPASGGAVVVLTGTDLATTTYVTIGGTAVSHFEIVDGTTLRVVTPPHGVGGVDVSVTTAMGTATQVNAYTYVSTGVGQAAWGGTIACIGGGLQNLVAATVDNGSVIEWGGFGILTNATSGSDGASNSASIVTVLGLNGGGPYAAKLCSDYEVDTQGGTPCQGGRPCYTDWFLPSYSQLDCLYFSAANLGLYPDASYWSSTESSADRAYLENVGVGTGLIYHDNKNTSARARCVRAFVP